MDKNHLVVIGAQVVVFVTLAVLVALGHDSTILDGLTGVAGLICGGGILSSVQQVSKGKTPPSSD